MSVPYIYMCQDGLQISGVGTIGLNLLMHDPLCHLLYLNVDEKLPIPLQKETRFYHLRSSKSHDPILVANKLTEIVNQCKSPKVTILPNTGDTNYGAAMECLRNNLDKPGKRLAILGIVHGDQKNPYEVIRHYEPSIKCFAGISTWCRDRLKEYIPHRRNQVFWLPPAASTTDLPTTAKESRHLRLLYLGRLVKQDKCVHRLFDLSIELQRLKSPFTLTIIGDGPDRESLESNFKSSVLQASKIRFLGRLQNESLAKEIIAHDLILSVSSTEGSPNSILEGMGAGLCPVVMDINSGIRDFIIQNHNGIIVKQGDILAMAMAISELNQNKKRLISLKTKAHKTIKSEFSISAQISKLHSLIGWESDSVCMEKINGLTHYMESHVQRTVSRVLDENLTNCAVYGAGMYGRKLIDALLLKKIRPSVIFDSYALNADHSYKNIPIVHSERILEFNVTTFVIGSIDFHLEIEDRINLCFANAGKTPPLLLSHCT